MLEAWLRVPWAGLVTSSRHPLRRSIICGRLVRGPWAWPITILTILGTREWSAPGQRSSAVEWWGSAATVGGANSLMFLFGRGRECCALVFGRRLAHARIRLRSGSAELNRRDSHGDSRLSRYCGRVGRIFVSLCCIVVA